MSLTKENQAKAFLKQQGLKNPSIDSGISGGGDSPCRHVSDALEAYAAHREQQAVKKALEVAANNVCMVHHDGRTKFEHNLGYFQNGADNIQVDKNSILSLDPAAIISEMEAKG
jgi:hypothetical protein